MTTIFYRDNLEPQEKMKKLVMNNLLLSGNKLREAIAAREQIGHNDLDLYDLHLNTVIADNDTLPNDSMVSYQLRKAKMMKQMPSAIHVNPQKWSSALVNTNKLNEKPVTRIAGGASESLGYAVNQMNRRGEIAHQSENNSQSRGERSASYRSRSRSPRRTRSRSNSRDRYRPHLQRERNEHFEKRRDHRDLRDRRPPVARKSFPLPRQSRNNYGNRRPSQPYVHRKPYNNQRSPMRPRQVDHEVPPAPVIDPSIIAAAVLVTQQLQMQKNQQQQQQAMMLGQYLMQQHNQDMPPHRRNNDRRRSRSPPSLGRTVPSRNLANRISFERRRPDCGKF